MKTEARRPEKGEVYIFTIRLDKDRSSLDRLSGFLSEEEIGRANRFRFAADRERFIVARGVLRNILGGCIGVGPSSIRLIANRYGKPFLDSPNDPLRFNVSHSKDIAVIAVASGREVGVDIEFVNFEMDVISIAGEVFSEPEMALLRSLRGESRTRTFFRGWTRKEAYLKALGKGFSGEAKKASVDLVPDSRIDSFAARGDGSRKVWSGLSIQVEEGFESAVVTECQESPVDFKCFGEFVI